MSGEVKLGEADYTVFWESMPNILGRPFDAYSLIKAFCCWKMRKKFAKNPIWRSVKNYGRESVNGDFPRAKLENAKKNRQNFFLANMKKPGTYIDYHVKPHLCTKFGDSSLKNEFRNAKRVWLIKWSIMRIFNEAEPPWSNLSEILGQ